MGMCGKITGFGNDLVDVRVKTNRDPILIRDEVRLTGKKITCVRLSVQVGKGSPDETDRVAASHDLEGAPVDGRAVDGAARNSNSRCRLSGHGAKAQKSPHGGVICGGQDTAPICRDVSHSKGVGARGV